MQICSRSKLHDISSDDLAFAAGDVIYLAGSREAIFSGLALLRDGPQPSATDAAEHDDVIASE